MDTILQSIADFIATHAILAGPVFGLFAFGESLAVLGVIIPATPVLFLVGTLLGSGKLDPWWVIPWAIFGAIAGYWVSWQGGRRMGTTVYRHRVFTGQRRAIARTRLYFRRWGGPSLMLGRYVLGPFQSMLPMVAGVAAMDGRRFHAWNTISGCLWVVVVVTPGYLAAKGVTVLGFGAEQQRILIALLLIVSAGLAVGAIVLTGYRLARLTRSS
ncbi:DedA family protein [Sphingomonas sp. HMWF008]|nr:DedA family protein [Sphingomonas sp. HMWF008]